MTHTQILHHRTLVLAALLISLAAPWALCAPVKQANWLPNMTAALAHAKKQDKLVLAYFSGSDWDEWGKKLDKEVLKTPMFAEWAEKNVILFQADFLATPKKQDLYKKQNEELKTRYQVSVV